jgi:hypothetical protein
MLGLEDTVQCHITACATKIVIIGVRDKCPLKWQTCREKNHSHVMSGNEKTAGKKARLRGYSPMRLSYLRHKDTIRTNIEGRMV